MAVPGTRFCILGCAPKTQWPPPGPCPDAVCPIGTPARPAPPAEVLGVPLVGVSPIEIPDPFWHPLHGFPYSAAVHPLIASGLAPPLVRPP